MFKIMTSKPVKNNFFMTVESGGLNNAIEGKPTDPEANVLSNCVGFANGRFNMIAAEIAGDYKFRWQLTCNAENFIERAKKLGLEVSDRPTLGGIMCWAKGSLSGEDGAGHVEIVERIDSDNKIFTSGSSYGGEAFYNKTRTNNNGRWGQTSAYTFRGCIVNPLVKELPLPDKEAETYTVKAGDTLSKIANRNNLTLKQLLSYNPQIQNPNLIYRGQLIYLTPVKVYTVKKGDTLTKIAKAHGVTLDHLKACNPQIKDANKIYPGQQINL